MNSNAQYYYRFLSEKIKKLFDHFSVVIVSGARQVGKSTLLEHCFPQLKRIVFDPVIDVENARKDPDLFLSLSPPPVILDEIQYAPELVSAIKRYLEKEKHPGLFLITGSQQWGVMKLLSESLAGRAVFVDLEGFSLGETNQIETYPLWLEEWLKDPHRFAKSAHSRLNLKFPLLEQIWRGSLPEAQFLPQDLLPTFFASYHRTYIERDLRLLANISDLQLFGRFYKLCAALTAQETNFNQIGRELGVNSQTASSWLDLLKYSFQWFEIPPYHGNTVKRISKKPKGYLSDTGLICWSQAISNPEVIHSHPLWGSLFETLVVTEIRKQAQVLSAPPQSYHWRSHGGAEVDLILEWNGKFYPIEIKAKSLASRFDTSGILAFRKEYPKLSIQPGLVICPTEGFQQISHHDYALPWDIEK